MDNGIKTAMIDLESHVHAFTTETDKKCKVIHVEENNS